MDRATFEQMAQQYRSVAVSIGLQHYGTLEDAEDVAQDTMLKLWNYCEQLDDERNLSGYVARTAKNVCIDRDRTRRIEVVRTRKEASVLSLSPQEVMEEAEIEQLLQEAIASLQPQERRFFLMRQQEGLTAEEIGRMTGVPPSSVSSMISMARKKLFQTMTRRIKK